MKKIQLGGTRFKSKPVVGHTVVDDGDFILMSQYKWSLSKGYAVTQNPKTKKTISLHRLVMGAKKGQFVHHTNRNPLDNRKSNLQISNKRLTLEETRKKMSVSSKRNYKNNTNFRNAVSPSGKDAHLWRGDDVGYSGIHAWLKTYYGKADRCENDECPHESPKGFQWALIPGYEYKRRRGHFIRLCYKCHHRLDKNALRGWVTKKENAKNG